MWVLVLIMSLCVTLQYHIISVVFFVSVMLLYLFFLCACVDGLWITMGIVECCFCWLFSICLYCVLRLLRYFCVYYRGLCLISSFYSVVSAVDCFSSFETGLWMNGEF